MFSQLPEDIHHPSLADFGQEKKYKTLKRLITL